jgi:hypothetical protein
LRYGDTPDSYLGWPHRADLTIDSYQKTH